MMGLSATAEEIGMTQEAQAYIKDWPEQTEEGNFRFYPVSSIGDLFWQSNSFSLYLFS